MVYYIGLLFTCLMMKKAYFTWNMCVPGLTHLFGHVQLYRDLSSHELIHPQAFVSLGERIFSTNK